ncbi:hypothetical protein BGZ58_010646 [Dissophora ornata]|nr:hypothetical protein BGZ58_010646 [Dissophora ornata]
MTSSAHAPCANVASFVYTFETEPPQQQSSPKALIFNAHHKTPQANNNAHPNRHSFPCSNNIWQQHQQQMQQVQELQEKSSYQTPPPSPGRAARGPRLSLDTSQERLHKFTVIQHNNQSYLKLFTPTLVESPVSFLSANQQLQDKKLWENGPDEALQKKMEMERREVYQARSKQQLRGFLLGIWLGCLMGLLIVQQTAAKVYIPIHLARRDTSPLLLFMVFMSCFAAVRSGTRCMVAAIATCAAVLTCFATLIANHSVEFGVYKSVQGSSFRSTSNESP